MPGGQTRDIVFADEVKEFGGRLPLAKRFYSIDRIGGRWAFQFQRVETEKELAFNRGAHHLQTYGWLCGFPFEFVGGDCDWNKDHAVEPQRFGCVVRQNQMPVMDRIESAPKNSDLFQSILFVATALWDVFVSGEDMKLRGTL